MLFLTIFAVVSSSIFEAPQHLLGTDSDGKIEVIGSVLEQVKSIKKKVVVVAIVGLYRTGKSYLLNRLAGVNSGMAYVYNTLVRDATEKNLYPTFMFTTSS